jgi:tetratricopeptide (TPR) repeat protein
MTMRAGFVSRLAAGAALGAAAVAGVSACEREAADPRAGLAAVTSDILGLPVTTTSEAARVHYLRGLRDDDLGRGPDAHAHFAAAIAADSTFALAYLGAATTAGTAEEFRRNLELAERYATAASNAERLRVEIARLGLEGDVEGQLQRASQLVAGHAGNPRALLEQARILEGMNRIEESRGALSRALELAPSFFAAHVALANSYLFSEPRDLSRALGHARDAADLAPTEPLPHDVMGDVSRAQGDLPGARDAYTRAHERDPLLAGPLQQRGHVHAFLGHFAEARADYDSAAALGRVNERGIFKVFRGLVSVYAGDPRAAMAELNVLVARAPELGVADPRAVRIFALTSVATIAIHTGAFPAADSALRRRTELLLGQAEAMGSPAFRRAQEANIAYFDGWLAARRGDYATARRMADRITALVEPDADPRKLEPVDALLGLSALYQRRYPEALRRLGRADPSDVYVKHHLALALAAAGNSARAAAVRHGGGLQFQQRGVRPDPRGGGAEGGGRGRAALVPDPANLERHDDPERCGDPVIRDRPWHRRIAGEGVLQFGNHEQARHPDVHR